MFLQMKKISAKFTLVSQLRAIQAAFRQERGKGSGGVFIPPGVERAELICGVVSLQGARKAPQGDRVGVEVQVSQGEHCTLNGAFIL